MHVCAIDHPIATVTPYEMFSAARRGMLTAPRAWLSTGPAEAEEELVATFSALRRIAVLAGVGQGSW